MFEFIWLISAAGCVFVGGCIIQHILDTHPPSIPDGVKFWRTWE